MFYYLDGKFIQDHYNAIDIRDRGFLLGDGVFTTLKSVSGKLMFLDKHLERLNYNANKIKLNILLEKSVVSEICQILLSKNDLINFNAVIRITITRGVSGRGINILPNLEPLLLITVVKHSENTLPSVSLGTTSIIRYEKSITSQVKSLNYLEAILARDDAINNGFDDAVLLNTQGNIVCATVANIFFVHNNGYLVTPPINDGALPGIMRKCIMNVENNLEVVESSIQLSQLENYCGCFITNSVIGIQAVHKINHQVFSIEHTEIETIRNLVH